MLPIFDKRIIGDYNDEGFDSVDSEDFAPGEGGVLPERHKRDNIPTPMQPRAMSANDQWNYEQERRTEAEIMEREDRWLKERGVE